MSDLNQISKSNRTRLFFALGTAFFLVVVWYAATTSNEFLLALPLAAVVMAIALLWSQLQGHEAFLRSIEWASAGDFHLSMGYTIDHLSALMMVIVTTVAFLVMIYTDGYMSHDESYVRFYTYLSLFSSSMLGLVVSPNLVQIYIFWELVGMCSYLLIGFWYDRRPAADACQKAFVTNRVGDFGLLLGMLALYWCTGSFEFDIMGSRLTDLVESGALSAGFATLFAVLVFLGPVAKSAQYPLHVWLPDAMEGPTPNSALIHAATLVAAGEFLIAPSPKTTSRKDWRTLQSLSSAIWLWPWAWELMALVCST